MKRKLFALITAVVLIMSMLTACNEGGNGGKTTSTPTATPTKAEAVKVGIAMPTQSLQRWNQDGANLKSQLEAKGYKVTLQYADNKVDTQVNQIQNMIADGCKVLIIAAVDDASLTTVLNDAGDLFVISYDRLIKNTKNIDYYATFDNYKVGVLQAQYIIDTMKLKDAKAAGKTYNMEIVAGSPTDNNANFFYNGAMDTIKSYIDDGTLKILSGQKDFAKVATEQWNTEKAQNRVQDILASFYASGKQLDVVLCSNDSTALGAINALISDYKGTNWPIITGQDCDVANTNYIIKGKQAMAVFKDTRVLATQTVKMVSQYLNKQTVDVNDTTTYNNGSFVVPTYQCVPTVCTKENYKKLLIESGYYTENADGTVAAKK